MGNNNQLICCRRYTVPVLWDTKTETIVNNESAEIVRMLSTAFDELLPADKAAIDLYPKELRGEIDGALVVIYSRSTLT